MKQNKFMTLLKKAYQNAIIRIKNDNNLYKVLSIQYLIESIFRNKL